VNPSTKCFSSIFDLGPLTPKIDSPKFDQKSPITRLVWQIHQRCLRLIGGFRGWPIEWNHVQCCGPTLVTMATKFGHKSAYDSASMAHRPEMFAPTMGFSGMVDSMEPCKMLWGRPLLPWQRNLAKFGLFFDKIAHESSCMPDRPDMFGPRYLR